MVYVSFRQYVGQRTLYAIITNYISNNIIGIFMTITITAKINITRQTSLCLTIL